MRSVTLSHPTAGLVEANTGTPDADGSLWWVNKIDGWDSIDGSALVQPRAFADGAYVSDGYYGPRLITLEGTVVSTSLEAHRRARQHLAAVVNLLRADGSLTIGDEPDPLAASVRRASFASHVDGRDLLWQVGLIAADPIRYSTVPHLQTLTAPSGGGFTFPVVFPLVMGATPTNAATVNADGTEPSQVVVTLTPTGSMVDPIVVNETSEEFVQVLGSFTSPLVIDMAARTVRDLAGTSFRTSVVAGSTFWALAPGPSTVAVGLTSGAVSADFVWKDAYL